MATNHEEILYDWISARETRLSCARTLAGFSCEYEDRGSGFDGDDGVPRCYRSGADESDWCSQCQQRNRLYPGLALLRKRERLAFTRLCRSARRFKQRHDQATSHPARILNADEGTACGSAPDSSSSSSRPSGSDPA